MPVLLEKPLDWFKLRPQVRESFDEVELRRLGESLLAKQIMPVLCQPCGTVIAGERRVRAARLVGKPTLLASVAEEELDETRIKLFQLIENLQRADLKPIEKIQGVADVARMNPGWTGKKLAEALHVDGAEVSRMLRIAGDGVAMAALKGGLLKGVSDAFQIATAPHEQKAGLIALRQSGATREVLRRAKRPQQPAEKVTRFSAPLPSGVSLVMAGRDLDISLVVDILGEYLKSVKKARDDGLSLKSWEAGMRDKARAEKAS